MTTSILLALPFALLDTVAAGTVTGEAFALPARSTQLTWQTILATAPASITVLLEISLDDINFSTLDTSTAVGGAVRTVTVNGGFIRAHVSAISGGGTMTVLLDAKDL